MHLADSTKTEQGWKYHYKNLKRTILSSLEPSEFSFESKRERHIIARNICPNFNAKRFINCYSMVTVRVQLFVYENET